MHSDNLNKDEAFSFQNKGDTRSLQFCHTLDSKHMTEDHDRIFIENTSQGQRSVRQQSRKLSDKVWSIQRLYPLAACRGKIKACDVCGLRATRQCSKCQTTSFCSLQHQLTDPFHNHICDRLSTAYKERPFSVIKEVRELNMRKVKVLKEELVEHITFLGEKSMYMENYESAILSFQQLIRFSTDVFGAHSENVLVAYIYLTEALVNTGAFTQAKSALGRAIVIFDVLTQKALYATNRNNSSSIALYEGVPESMMQSTKIALLNVKSMVSSAFGEYDDALFYMADSIYYLADMHGEEDVRLATRLHSMGNIFELQGSTEIAETFYSHSLTVYLQCLNHYVTEIFKQQEELEDSYLMDKKIESKLPIMIEGEAKLKLWKMYTTTKASDRLALDFAKACTGLSSLYYMASKYSSAKTLAQQALNKKQTLTCPLLHEMATNLLMRSEWALKKERKTFFFSTEKK